jgi:DNA-binding NarL/FixJ family response regulator
VLLADESAAVRLLLAALLHDDERFSVVGDVATGAEIIERCPDADLVVVDLVLADTDAFSLIERVHLHHPALPVVVYAEVDPPYLRSEASARGAAAFFTHRTDPTAVLDGFAAAAEGGMSE